MRIFLRTTTFLVLNWVAMLECTSIFFMKQNFFLHIFVSNVYWKLVTLFRTIEEEKKTNKQKTKTNKQTKPQLHLCSMHIFKKQNYAYYTLTCTIKSKKHFPISQAVSVIAKFFIRSFHTNNHYSIEIFQ